MPYDINHPIGNIYASAYLLRMHLDEYQGNYLNALTRYKGWCAEGRRRALKVKEIYGRAP